MRRGRLSGVALAPERGELHRTLAHLGAVRIDEIVSGVLDAPVAFVGETDEWVVVLEGAATVEIAGERMELGPGDWVVIPAGVAHTVAETRPGTRWLAVYAPPVPLDPPGC